MMWARAVAKLLQQTSTCRQLTTLIGFLLTSVMHGGHMPVKLNSRNESKGKLSDLGSSKPTHGYWLPAHICSTHIAGISRSPDFRFYDLYILEANYSEFSRNLQILELHSKALKLSTSYYQLYQSCNANCPIAPFYLGTTYLRVY